MLEIDLAKTETCKFGVDTIQTSIILNLLAILRGYPVMSTPEAFLNR